MNDPGRVVVLGAGPTGLGAAYRLEEAGYTDATLLEATSRLGGLATSFVDRHGFTWDIGGHVHFSHYPYYDEVFSRVLGERTLQHRRESWIWTHRRFVPYPFQYNVHHLDAEEQQRALAGLQAAVTAPPAAAENFRQWIEATFGDGIADLFMLPYNEKVWGYPLEELSADWIAERVAVPDLAEVERSLRTGEDHVGWGPNQVFRYPLDGGTGALWRGVAGLLEHTPIELESRVVGVELESRRVVLADGRRVPWDTLISSLPLDRLCPLVEGLDAEIRAAARSLLHSSCHVVGIGLRGAQPAELADKGWMYFPEPESPYYRVTVLSNYSPHNTPDGADYWSLLTEVCDTPHRPVESRDVVRRVLEAAERDLLIPRRGDVVSLWHRHEPYGYPTPSLHRDAILERVQPALERHRIFSRGRFGAWRYEASNQDHSFMQGAELAERLLGVGEEVTVRADGAKPPQERARP